MVALSQNNTINEIWCSKGFFQHYHQTRTHHMHRKVTCGRTGLGLTKITASLGYLLRKQLFTIWNKLYIRNDRRTANAFRHTSIVCLPLAMVMMPTANGRSPTFLFGKYLILSDHFRYFRSYRLLI